MIPRRRAANNAYLNQNSTPLLLLSALSVQCIGANETMGAMQSVHLPSEPQQIEDDEDPILDF